MTQEATLEMARYIWKIVCMGGAVSMSWGIDPSSLKQIENGVSFHVQGLKHRGLVEIIYDEGSDYFNVSFVKDENPTERETVEDVAFDELVRVIDEKVEYTGTYYTEQIRKELGFPETE